MKPLPIQMNYVLPIKNVNNANAFLRVGQFTKICTMIELFVFIMFNLTKLIKLLLIVYSNEAKARNGTIDEDFVMYEQDGSIMEPQMGCITDDLGPGGIFVAPIYAKFCSRHCYYLIPHNSIYYYDHEDINTAKAARRGRLEKLKQPAPPTKGDGAPRLNRLHVCPYEGFDHKNFINVSLKRYNVEPHS